MRRFDAGWRTSVLIAILVAGAPFGSGARATDARDESRLALATARCAKSAELVACAEALNMRPNNPALLVAEADALVQWRRPGEAIGVYRNALTVHADRAVVTAKILSAQVLRHALLESCLTQMGQLAEHACEAAWLPGAADEIDVFKRRGVLLQGERQFAAALDAYMAAARLRPRDRAVARAVLSLSGRIDRTDGPTLTARGAAYATLGQRSEAIVALREALRVAPESVAAQDMLRALSQVAPVPRARPAVRAHAEPGDVAVTAPTNQSEASRSN